MKHILVTGGNGQLGLCLKDILSERAFFLDLPDFDICNEILVNDFVKENKIHTILNCAAYTAVDLAENDSQLAYNVNVIGPSILAKAMKLVDGKLIHISTDYVFDGCNHRPWHEEDQTHPVSVYGETKLAGEKKVMEYSTTCAIIRTAWLWSFYGKNFYKTMAFLGNDRDEINVVSDQIGSPTFAPDLAKVMILLTEKLQKNDKEIFHYTNEGVCSWYDFARAVIHKNHGKAIVNPIASSSYPTPAKRPFYSVLDKSKIKKFLNITIPHWTESI